MSSRRGAGTAAIAMALSLAAVGVARAASIDIGSSAGVPGSDVVVEVSLRTMGAAVEGTQNRINFDRQTFVPARAGGQPDCAVNPAIHKSGTAFRFLPVDCDPAVDCTALRAFVIAFDNLDTIPDGSVLYSCRIAIAADASEGTHVLGNSETRASGVVGATVPTTGTDGAVIVASSAVAEIAIGSATATAGTSTAVAVTLNLIGVPPPSITGARNDIGFAPQAPIAADGSGQPQCEVNAELGKPDSTFDFVPAGCTPGMDCTGVRANVSGDSSPIPDGATLYSCAVAIPAGTAPGTYALTAGMPVVFDQSGVPLPALVSDGEIAVTEAPTPACVGDCDGSATVGIDELLVGVNISLGSAAAAVCAVFDADEDGRVAVNELVQAVRNALAGCQ